MTTATTKTRTRKAQATAKALIPRGQHLIDLGADFLILSARMAETPLPVFWAEGELDARTTLAVPADGDYDDNYRRVLDDPWWDWNWYRDAKLADELEQIPVAVVTLGELDEAAEAHLKAFLAATTPDVPGPVEGAHPPAPPGPGTREDNGDG